MSAGTPSHCSTLKDSEALEEWYGAGRLALVVRPPAFVVRHEAVGIYDGRAPLALAYVATETQGLPERQPALDRVAVLDDGAPEDQHVDA
jgi:hypothetical protein